MTFYFLRDQVQTLLPGLGDLHNPGIPTIPGPPPSGPTPLPTSYTLSRNLQSLLFLVPKLCTICSPLLLMFSPTWNTSPSFLANPNPALWGCFSPAQSVENSEKRATESGIRSIERGQQRRESSGDTVHAIRARRMRHPHVKCMKGLATDIRTKDSFVLLMTLRLFLTA